MTCAKFVLLNHALLAHAMYFCCASYLFLKLCKVDLMFICQAFWLGTCYVFSVMVHAYNSLETNIFSSQFYQNCDTSTEILTILSKSVTRLMKY
jgi:hypothetical protein